MDKKWWMSKGVIGSLLVILVLGLRLLGKVGEAEAIEAESEGIATWWAEAAGMIAAAIAFWGRVKAKGPIAPVL